MILDMYYLLIFAFLNFNKSLDSNMRYSIIQQYTWVRSCIKGSSNSQQLGFGNL